MQSQLHLDFNRESTVNRVEHRLIRTVSPPIQEFSPIQVPKPKLTFVTGFKKLTEATHSKFMKLAKLDFRKYSGASDPTYWIRQSEQFFHCHAINNEDRVSMATFHLDGHAQLWYKFLFDDEGELNWPEFCDRLHELENFTGELVKLVQSGSVQDYEV